MAARKLILMPISSAKQLAKVVGDPTMDRRLTFIDNTSRCGSTLLCQMVDTVPNVRVLSEPWAMISLFCLCTTGQISVDELKPLVDVTVRVLCKKERNTQIDHIMIKNCSIGSSMSPMIAELFPKAGWIFNTR